MGGRGRAAPRPLVYADPGGKEVRLGAFFDRFVTQNAQLLALVLRTVSERLEEAAPGPPATVIAGWQQPITDRTEVDMGEISVSNEDTTALTGEVSFKDAKGKATSADDVPQWTSSDDAVATVLASEDGLTANITIHGEPGSSVISVHSVNDDGSVVDATGLVNVAAGDAVIGSVEFKDATPAGTVEEEPPAEEAPA